MRVVETVIAVIWIAFWLYWIAVASGAKQGRTRWGRFAVVRVVLVLVVLLLVRDNSFKGQSEKDPLLWGVGLAVFVAGLLLALWARHDLGRNWGMPMSEKTDPELVTSGPYRRVRHPIYSGLILAMLGTSIAVGWYWLIAVGALGFYFVYSALNEERYMTGVFPDAYPAYKRSTKMLIPFVV